MPADIHTRLQGRVRAIGDLLDKCCEAAVERKPFAIYWGEAHQLLIQLAWDLVAVMRRRK